MAFQGPSPCMAIATFPMIILLFVFRPVWGLILIVLLILLIVCCAALPKSPTSTTISEEDKKYDGIQNV